MHSEDDDNTTLVVKEKNARRSARVSDSDKAALLSSGVEDNTDEEYTDIFAASEIKKSGKFINNSSLEEGNSVSGSDKEIIGYSGDVENYIDDDNDNGKDLDTCEFDIPRKSNIKEGRLICVNTDDEEGEELKENLVESIGKSLTNDSISEIANKLEETIFAAPKAFKDNFSNMPGMPVKVNLSNDDELTKETSLIENESDSTSAKESNTDLPQMEILIDNNANHSLKRKKLRKKANHQNELESSLDNIDTSDTAQQIKRTFSHEKQKHKRKTYRHKVATEQSEQNNKIKLIDIESPSHTPLHGKNQSNLKTSDKKRVYSNSKRKRYRYKIYLDDPDVHELIHDHVVMLQRYMDEMNHRSQTKKVISSEEEFNDKHGQSLPDVSFVGVNISEKSKKDNKKVKTLTPDDGHHNKHRGRDFISRIRDSKEHMSSSSDENESLEERYEKIKVNKAMHGKNLCPDCGEIHTADEEDFFEELNNICPDCGVRHNPYQHSPSIKDPDDEKKEGELPSIVGPHTLEELTNGYRYKMKYLGSSQIITHHPVTKETRMQQAQDAYNRIKGQDGDDEDDVSTNVDMVISVERIKIVNMDTKFEDIIMDHALRTVCFVCDMGKILVLMARRLTSDHSTDFTVERGKPISLGTIVGDREKKTSKNICHVFECEVEASKIAKAIGQAFNIAYRNFLQLNGISHEHVEEAEYCHVLETQKLVGEDLDRLANQDNAKEVVVTKKRGEWLGVMLLESGWGSMLPTVFIAHLAQYSPATVSQKLTVGDHILSCNGTSLVGLPLSECNNIIKNCRSSNRVLLKTVSCPPVVDVILSRPDVKYQLGFSVQNGTICSLLRGGIAERGGIRVGHRIIEINGDSVVNKTHQNIVEILATTTGTISIKTMPVSMYRLMVGEDQPHHI